MSAPLQFTAIEINSPKTWEILIALDPRFGELDYEFNYGFFVVINHQNTPVAIMSPATVADYFDHIEPSGDHVKLVNLVGPKK